MCSRFRYGDADQRQGDTENGTLFGGSGNDTLEGNEHDDELHGDADNDVLNGEWRCPTKAAELPADGEAGLGRDLLTNARRRSYSCSRQQRRERPFF